MRGIGIGKVDAVILLGAGVRIIPNIGDAVADQNEVFAVAGYSGIGIQHFFPGQQAGA